MRTQKKEQQRHAAIGIVFPMLASVTDQVPAQPFRRPATGVVGRWPCLSKLSQADAATLVPYLHPSNPCSSRFCGRENQSIDCFDLTSWSHGCEARSTRHKPETLRVVLRVGFTALGVRLAEDDRNMTRTLQLDSEPALILFSTMSLIGSCRRGRERAHTHTRTHTHSHIQYLVTIQNAHDQYTCSAIFGL